MQQTQLVETRGDVKQYLDVPSWYKSYSVHSKYLCKVGQKWRQCYNYDLCTDNTI